MKMRKSVDILQYLLSRRGWMVCTLAMVVVLLNIGCIGHTWHTYKQTPSDAKSYIINLDRIMNTPKEMSSDVHLDHMLNIQTEMVPVEQNYKSEHHMGLSESNGSNDNMCVSKTNWAAPFQIVGYGHTQTPNCTKMLCSLNYQRKEVQVVIKAQDPCIKIEDCVTAVVKTAKRLYNIVSLINSFRQYNTRMRIIVTDEYHEGHLKNVEFQRILSTDAYVTYVQGPHGLASGRNIGMKLVATKYFLLLDDDYQLSQNTNISKMVDVLDRSDISIVGGLVGDVDFEGVFRVHVDSNFKTTITQFTKVAYETVPCFSNCVMVDIVKNFFMAKTKDIINAGGWNDALEVIEHKDFFFKIRQGRLKVALCTDISITHFSTEGDFLRLERMKRVDTFRTMFEHIWNIQPVKICGHNQYKTNTLC